MERQCFSVTTKKLQSCAEWEFNPKLSFRLNTNCNFVKTERCGHVDHRSIKNNTATLKKNTASEKASTNSNWIYQPDSLVKLTNCDSVPSPRFVENIVYELRWIAATKNIFYCKANASSSNEYGESGELLLDLRSLAESFVRYGFTWLNLWPPAWQRFLFCGICRYIYDISCEFKSDLINFMENTCVEIS